MSVMVVIGPCYVCGRTFEFSPTKVPSITPPGKEHRDREPVCETCMVTINAKREEMGLTPFRIMPGAYEGDADLPDGWPEC